MKCKILMAALAGMLVLSHPSRAESLLAIDSGDDDNSSTVLSFDTDTQVFQRRGETGIAGINDIAVGRAGRLFGVTYTHLLRINCRTGKTRLVGGPIGFRAVALTVSPTNQLYAADADGRLISISRTTGVGTLVGRYGHDLKPSGDLVFVGNKLYGVAQSNNYGTDVLVRINRTTGKARVVGELGVNNVFGLAEGTAGQIFGFTENGVVVEIDRFTGQSLQIATAGLSAPIYGAGNTCR